MSCSPPVTRGDVEAFEAERKAQFLFLGEFEHLARQRQAVDAFARVDRPIDVAAGAQDHGVVEAAERDRQTTSAGNDPGIVERGLGERSEPDPRLTSDRAGIDDRDGAISVAFHAVHAACDHTGVGQFHRSGRAVGETGSGAGDRATIFDHDRVQTCGELHTRAGNAGDRAAVGQCSSQSGNLTVELALDLDPADLA